MKTLIIPVGCPGMGKSYWAKQMFDKYGIKSVSSDDVREKLYGDAAIQGDYKKVFSTVYETIRSLFNQGEQIVILDATNVTRHVRHKAICSISPSEIIYIILPDDLDRAIENNKKRSRIVPEHIVRRMYKSYKKDMPTSEKDFFKGIDCAIYYMDNDTLHNFYTRMEKYDNEFSSSNV